MGITSSGLDLEDTFFNCQKGDIESSSSKIENENIAFAGDFLIKAIRDSRSGRFIDDSLIIRLTLRPAMVPASLVACHFKFHLGQK